MRKKPLPKLFILFYYVALILLLSRPLAAENINLTNINLTKQDLIERNFTVEIELGQVLSIRGFNNVTKFTAVSPGIASINLVSNSEISITSLKVGSTFIHVWDNQELLTMRLTVKFKGFERIEEEAKRRVFEEKVNTIKASYSYNLSKLRSRSENAPFEWKTQEDTHTFKVYGDTPYGYFDSNYSYLFRKDQQGLANDIQSVDLKLSNKYFTIAGGDLTTFFSNVTLPSTHIQGLEFNSSPDLKNFKYDFVAGSTGYYLWGKRISSFGQIENRFYGLRTEISPEKDLSFSTTYMGSVKKTDKASHDLGSLGAKYKVGEHFLFEGEVAKNAKNRTALFSSIKLDIDKLSSTIAYRDIGVDYLTITGYTPYQGRKGVYTRTKFQPYKILSFSADFNVYQNKLNPDPDSLDKGNKDLSFTSQLISLPTDTNFLVSFYHWDDRGQQFPVVTSGQRYEINQTLKKMFLLGDIYAYLVYEPSRYKSFTSGESNYLDKITRGGIRISPIRGLSFYIQEMLNFRDWPVRDYSTFPRRFEAVARYGSNIGKLPLYASMYVGCQVDSHVNDDKITNILGEDKIRGGAEFTYAIAPYLSCFLTADIEKVDGSVNTDLDRVQTNIYAGARVLWDTGIAWRGYGTIKGYVFKDVNANGVMDEGEPPIKGAKVFVDAKRFGITNASGFYRIKGVPEGLRDVSLNLDTLPPSYISTTPVTVSVKVVKMESQEANFGTLPKTTITGFIFNDLNRDNVFDEGDEALSNISVTLEDGKRAATDFYGHFTIYNVSAGKHTLKVNTDTVPKGLLPGGTLSQDISIEEGKSEEAEFFFYALRVISGRVFIDHNENGRFDKGEGVKEVRIPYKDKSVTTDEEGVFILRNLPSGKVTITVDKTSLPEGYMPEKDTIELELSKSEDIRENNDIKLIRKP